MGAVVERGKTQGGGSHIEITYGGRESPFAGIDSTALDPYIAPNALTRKSANVIALSNTLEAASWQDIFRLTTGDATDIFMGVGDLLGQVFIVSFNGASSSININGYPNFPSQTDAYLIGNVPVPNAISAQVTPGNLTFKNVNGVCFFSFPWLPYIIQHNNNSAAVLTSYLGCAFLNELNGRLIAANIYQYAPAQSSTTYNPSSANTQTISARAAYPSTQTEDSYVIDGFTSYTPGTGDVFDLNYTLAGSTFSSNAQAPFGTGNYKVQYSVDGGSTWVTGFNGNAYNQSTVTPFTASVQIYGVTDLSLVQIRLEVTSTPSSMFTDGAFVIQFTLSNVSITLTSNSGSSAGVYEYPYQFAWSAALEAYAQFNPLVNGLVTGAGYNNLPDVEDEITGMFMTGPTAYVLRNEGITEVTPLSSGIQPFAFNHLWASHKGIGTIYPNSVMQYGSLGAFLSDSDIYTIGYDGINTIGNKAKEAIYEELIDLYGANFLCGNMDAFSLKGNRFIGASLAAVNPSTPFDISLYTFKQDTKEWFRFTIPTGTTESYGMQFSSVQALSVPLLFNAQGSTNNCTIYSLNKGAGIQVGNDTTTIVFPAEELVFERDITIDGIGMLLAGVENLPTTLICTLNINSTAFTSITDVNLTMDGTFAYLKLWPTGLPFTAFTPQLTLSITVTGDDGVAVNFTIGKIVLFGTVNPSQRPS
jgi:hypothetical protein